MREVEPQQARGRLVGISQKVMVVCPDDCDEQIAYRVAEPRRPERQHRLKGWSLRRAQLQHQNRNEHGKNAVGKCAQSLRSGSAQHDPSSLSVVANWRGLQDDPLASIASVNT